jgi:checkpoint serine/threonine-protein kinase
MVFCLTRKAEPLDHLKKMHIEFLKQLESTVEESNDDAQVVKANH